MWALHQLRRRIVGCHCPGLCGTSGSHGHLQGLPVERRCSVTSAAPSAGRTSCFDRFVDMVSRCKTTTSSSTASASSRAAAAVGQMSPLDDRCKTLSCKRCRSLCIQIILVVVNFIFLMLGWALIAFGIWLHIYQDSLFITHLLKDYSSSSSSSSSATSSAAAAAAASASNNTTFIFDTVPFLLIWIGLFVAAMSFLGCYGACAENVCFLGFYTFLLVIIMVAEILLASQSTYVIEKLSRKMSLSMESQLVNEYNKTALQANRTSTETYKVTMAWDTLQITMNCCGVHGPQDYMRSVWFNVSDYTEGVFVPQSCCVLLKDDVDDDDDSSNVEGARVADYNYCQVHAILFPNSQNKSQYLKTDGCHPVVTEWLYGYASHAFLILTVLISTQMTDLILACALMNWVRKKQTDHWWWEEADY